MAADVLHSTVVFQINLSAEFFPDEDLKSQKKETLRKKKVVVYSVCPECGDWFIYKRKKTPYCTNYCKELAFARSRGFTKRISELSKKEYRRYHCNRHMDFLKRWKEKDIEGWRAYVRRANEKAVAKRTPEEKKALNKRMLDRHKKRMKEDPEYREKIRQRERLSNKIQRLKRKGLFHDFKPL